MPWPTLFISTLWELWKNRNDWVFNTIMLPIAAICSRAITWARYYSGVEQHAPPIASLRNHAWDRGIEILQVQSDCKEAIQMLTSPLANVNSSSLARAIVKLCNRGWSVDLIWIARSSNQAADALARRADVSAFDTIALHSPPEFLRPLLCHDISNSSFDLA
ncbi:hypothetical protein V6N11_076965 [Hibiscus sabdariffa]|uniref:RNase H type-1 domain-containing protein n=1 Tax=Hibiscus sabdariffa TaxID=183260 RepID=A0ABR2TCK5_9ROSI